jgi:16S rRNA (adenine1518-N6/adenine1519-N6)-dimethyltransferase
VPRITELELKERSKLSKFAQRGVHGAKKINSKIGITMEATKYHRPKKKYGQHFLQENWVVKAMLDAAEIDSKNEIIEIGPGLGFLTQALCTTSSHVTAIEIDEELTKRLYGRFKDNRNLSIICADILTINLDAFTQKIGEYIVVANLPYYIGTSIIQKFLELSHKPKRIVVMLQKEVAESIAASNENNTYLSAYVKYFGHPEIIKIISPESFNPKPKVYSAILKIDLHDVRQVSISDNSENKFFSLIRIGFSAPRKQLRNVFAKALNIHPFEIEIALTKAGINPKNRAGNLNLQQWSQLYEAVKDTKWIP